MNLSAILVVTRPETIRSVCSEFGRLPGIDVHHIDAESGRAILTQEADTVDDEVQGLKRLQNHPQVAMAEMVEHHFDNVPSSPEQSS